MTQLMRDILNLSIPERILMVEAIWDSLSENEKEIILSNDDKILLDQRLADHQEYPSEGSEWQEVKARIKKQL
jgi:putative addiction module component (TIGR02574 family)